MVDEHDEGYNEAMIIVRILTGFNFGQEEVILQNLL
jgi:hypothetical protein